MRKAELHIRYYCFIAFLICFTFSTNAQVYDMVVAKDGSGDYTSIQAAINKIRPGTATPTRIFVKAGTYEEKVRLYETQKNVSLIGEGAEKVIISWDDYSGDSEGNSTSSSYTFLAEGDNFYAENITFSNTAGDVGQAVALSTVGMYQVFNNCRMLGFQDTYYAKKGMQYNLNCYIEGATDFIFGEATSIFDSCEIKCLKGGQYITAPADTKLISQEDGRTIYHGLLFVACNITAEDGVDSNTYYLGRPWQPNASTVFVNSTLGSHIRDTGWSTWDSNNHETGFFAEYRSVNPNGELVDVSKRTSWSTQLSTEEVMSYYNSNFFLQDWDPSIRVRALPAPQEVNQDMQTVTSGFTMSWDAVEGALGYVIQKNDSTVGFAADTYFEDPSSKSGDIYRVRTVGASGGLGDYSESVEALLITANGKISPDFQYQLINKRLELALPCTVELYGLSGQRVMQIADTMSVDLSGFGAGIYLLKLKNAQEAVGLFKIAL